MPPEDSVHDTQRVPSSPEAQVLCNDHTNAPINTSGPMIADDFSVCAVKLRSNFPYAKFARTKESLRARIPISLLSHPVY